ncbi:hypothetical protein BDR07DRAFT_1409775 [Suillus spraguei]|nr:hypothetical protein BDR07DRAFT_1409775 [Suillus spraguei]
MALLTPSKAAGYVSPELGSFRLVISCLGWLSLDTSIPATKVEPNNSYPNQSLPVSELNEEHDDGSDTAGEDDKPPAFPAINSAQRAATSPSSSDSSTGFSIPKVLTDPVLMSPPPVSSLVTRQPGVPLHRVHYVFLHL